jgi:translation initiation factor IF-3
LLDEAVDDVVNQFRRGFINSRDFRRDPREPRVNMNDRIRAREIRVIDDDGTQLGIMTPRDALAIARERGIDLIEVAPQAQPPVCKIMDYGKYKYEQAKREKDSAKKHKQSELKGIQMFPNIEDHDFTVKVKSAIKFLEDGDKVKVTIRFKGRQITHPEFGRQQLDKVIQMVSQVGQVEKPASMEGRMMTMILSPLKGAHKPGEGHPEPPRPKPAAPPPPSGAPSAGAPPSAP